MIRNFRPLFLVWSVVVLLVFLLTTRINGTTDGTEDGTQNEQQQQQQHRQLTTIFRSSSKNCPPKGFDALKEFNLTTYISKSWYIQKQKPVSYQPIESFYCVRADYVLDTSFCFLCGNKNKKKKISIYNQARRDSVNGTIGDNVYDPTTSTGSGLFLGIQKDGTKDPAKITVGYLSRFPFTRSNYWIVAAGTYADALSGFNNPIPASHLQYDFAIITGGMPNKETDTNTGKCVPAERLFDLYGMWMFTRDAIVPKNVLDGIETLADSMGLDVTKWLPVQQEGCVYKN